MRRRDFIAALGVSAALPIAVQAQQQRDRLRRVGMLFGAPENDPEGQASRAAIIQELARLGWVEGRNVRIDQRWPNGYADLSGKFAKELVELQPDVIVSVGSPATAALQRETRTIPIVFVSVFDPVGQGFVAGLPRSGSNLTGFSQVEAAFIGKLVQMLKEIAPDIRRVALMHRPDVAQATGMSLAAGPFEAAAQVLALDPINIAVNSDAEIETVIDALGREEGGLLCLADMISHRAVIIAASARNKVPAIYSQPTFAREGGLISYAPNWPDMFRGAAGYVDRILKGNKPADLPVQLPTKYEMVLNLKTAKALGIDPVPTATLLRADEVIE